MSAFIIHHFLQQYKLIANKLPSVKCYTWVTFLKSVNDFLQVFRVLTSHQGDGQAPPSPVTHCNQKMVDHPIHMSNLRPVGVSRQSPDPMVHSAGALFRPSTMTPIEDSRCVSLDRESLYDNLHDPQVVYASIEKETYATVGKASGTKQPSPELYQESLKSESGSADDSPEEEWTHL